MFRGRDTSVPVLSVPLPRWGGWIAGICVLLVAATTRLVELKDWMHPDNQLDHLPIMPSADVFAWLSGAAGTGRLTGWPLADLIRWLSDISGLPAEIVAFWLPLVLAPIPGVLVLLFCLARNQLLAGLSAGIMASCSLGFLARTRLGYADTDLFALALPLALALGLAAAVSRLMGGHPGSDLKQALPWLLGCVCLIGLNQFLYPSGYLIVLAIVVTGGVCLAATSGREAFGLHAWLVLGLVIAAHFDSVGMAVGFALVLLIVSRPAFFGPAGASFAWMGAIAAVIAWEPVMIEQTLRRLTAYSGIGPSTPGISDWFLPRVDDSIAETATVGLTGYTQRVGTHVLILLVGLAGYGWVLIRWPQTITLLPLLLLGLSSYWLGHRFAMYASPVLGLGLGLGLALLLERLRLGPAMVVTIQLIVAFGLASLLLWHARELRPDPSLEQEHVRALIELKAVDHDRGRVWTWWDFGYAAQFLTGLPTVADGGNTSRQRIFVLGQVYGSDRPEHAAALIRFLAAERRKDIERADEWRTASYRTQPLDSLTSLSAPEAQALLDRAEFPTKPPTDDLPDEFLVVSWQTLRRLPWIDFFGRWRLDVGDQGYGRIMTLRPPVELDSQTGILKTPEGPIYLASIDILEGDSGFQRRWPRSGGGHAVINNTNGQGLVMDGALYNTLAVQMLIDDPQVFADDFELVAEYFPAARVYRVR